MKIGFFGGSFNPPTNAHINMAKKAIEECKLDKVVFIPMGDSYGKKGLAKAKYRLQMLKIACSHSGLQNIEVSDLETKIEKKLYAIDAFRLIEKEYPNDDRYFIMGADNFINLYRWKESEKLSKYNYIVFQRGEVNLKAYIDKNKVDLRNIKIIENTEYKNSSATEFREIIKEDKNTSKGIIPNDVLKFIIENDIY